MARTVPEWKGRTDDTQAPPRVRARVFERCGGKCHRCGRQINAGEKWTLEHVIALINGGRNAESNLSVTCDWCLPEKNAEDVAIKAKSAKVRQAHIGIRPAPKLRGQGFRKAPSQSRATTPIQPKFKGDVLARRQQ